MNKILIVMRGGVIQDIVSKEPIEAIVMDYDTDGLTDEEVIKLDNGESICDTGHYPVHVDPRQVNKYFKTIIGEKY
jgi:hypothetical protein